MSNPIEDYKQSIDAKGQLLPIEWTPKIRTLARIFLVTGTGLGCILGADIAIGIALLMGHIK